MLNRLPWGGISFSEDSGLFPGVKHRIMHSLREHQDNGESWVSRAQAWLLDLFDLGRGMRNKDEHGVDLETQ
jgi:hypothetical protein